MFVFCLFGSLTEPLPCKPNAKFSLFFVLCSLFWSAALAFPPLSLSRFLTLPAPSLCLHPHSACTPWVAPCLGPLGESYLVFSSASACCFRAWSMDSELSSKPTTSAS